VGFNVPEPIIVQRSSLAVRLASFFAVSKVFRSCTKDVTLRPDRRGSHFRLVFLPCPISVLNAFLSHSLCFSLIGWKIFASIVAAVTSSIIFGDKPVVYLMRYCKSTFFFVSQVNSVSRLVDI